VTSPDRPLRADATRNRAALLAAAEAEFTERGLDASMADIARRAGVAKGTVFRHFASKEELIAAIVAGHFRALSDVARALDDAADPGAALVEFLAEAAGGQAHHDLSFLQTLTEGDSSVAAARDRLHADVERLVARARDAGAVRGDVTGTDVWVLICAPVHATGYVRDPAPDLWRRYLAIIVDGLRPAGAQPLPVPPPTWP
jgi:AcrR family transcriptional regulator